MARVVVFGTGQLADVAHFYLTHDSPHDVVAFTVDAEHLGAREHRGLPVVPFEEVERTFPPDGFRMFVPISYRRVNRPRAEKYQAARAKGYQLISYVCSRAVTWPDLTLGDNCFVFEANVIQPFVTIGNDVILWSGNHIGHHTTIGDHCFLASHVVVSGSVTIEPYCFLGVNATVRDNVTIGRECVIGAGALILEDTEPRGVYPGRGTPRIPKSSDQLRAI
jgi:sugar O-acyltransferase (sialic acid O-acetyltransferase NeuD family)